MNEYSVRLELKFDATTNVEVTKKLELFLKELPRMDGVSIDKYSIMNKKTREIVKDSTR